MLRGIVFTMVLGCPSLSLAVLQPLPPNSKHYYPIPDGLFAFENPRNLGLCLKEAHENTILKFPSDPALKTVDFTGDWILADVEGDKSAMLRAVGIPARLADTIANKLNYGIGLLRYRIFQYNDEFTVTTTLKGTMFRETVTYTVGKFVSDPGGKFCASWSNPEQTELEIHSKSPTKDMPILHRRLEGEFLIHELDAGGSGFMKEIFKKNDGSGPAFMGNISEVPYIILESE